MEWPRTPVERLQKFQPPYCPRRNCPEHLRDRPGYRFKRHGSYPNRRGLPIRRFRCLTCGATFSARAFSTTYYLKRPEVLLPVAALLQAGAGHRQIARSLGCAPSTVTRLSARLGRHALLLQAVVAAVWRNFVKRTSERRTKSATPAMKMGLTYEPWTFRRVLSRRLFPDREKISGVALAIYRRDWITPVLPSNSRHRLHFAY